MNSHKGNPMTPDERMPTKAQAKVLMRLARGGFVYGSYIPAGDCSSDGDPYGWSGGGEPRFSVDTGGVIRRAGWIDVHKRRYPSTYWRITDSGRAALSRYIAKHGEPK